MQCIPLSVRQNRSNAHRFFFSLSLFFLAFVLWSRMHLCTPLPYALRSKYIFNLKINTIYYQFNCFRIGFIGVYSVWAVELDKMWNCFNLIVKFSHTIGAINGKCTHNRRSQHNDECLRTILIIRLPMQCRRKRECQQQKQKSHNVSASDAHRSILWIFHIFVVQLY